MKLTDPNRRGLLGQGSILVDDFRRDQNLAGVPREVRAEHLPQHAPASSAAECPHAGRKQQGASQRLPKTVRAQLELHRKNPACASCHRVIDPAGFALENFDSVGKWRDTGPDGAPLDVAGTLADGSKVNGPAALREAILSRPDAFVTVVTERMLTYALGRGLEPGDMPVVRRIVKKAAQNDYRLSSIVMGIVESAPFQMRTKLEAGRIGRDRPYRTVPLNMHDQTSCKINKEQPCSSRRSTFRAARSCVVPWAPRSHCHSWTPWSRRSPRRRPRRSGSARSTFRAACGPTPGIPTKKGATSCSSR